MQRVLTAHFGRRQLAPQPKQVPAVSKLHDQVGVDGRRHQLPADEVVPAYVQSGWQLLSQPRGQKPSDSAEQLASAWHCCTGRLWLRAVTSTPL